MQYSVCCKVHKEDCTNIARGTLDNAGHVEWWQHYTNQLINGVEILMSQQLSLLHFSLLWLIMNVVRKGWGWYSIANQHALAGRVE